MKFFSVLYLAALGLPAVFAGGDGCCKFTLSSSGPFECPASQLDDGQIRLNSTNPTSTFCIDEKGRITDDSGFGCIVTEPPTTQIQCDQGKEPQAGFSISTDNTLLYNGSPNFFACPASDIEWNIYVTPDFGQPKCVPITLKTDGCGAPAPPPPPPPTTTTPLPPPPPTTTPCPAPPPASTETITVWQTQWSTTTTTQQGSNITVTSTDTQWSTETEIETETETEFVTEPCTSTWTGWNSTTKHCPKCTKTSTGGVPTGTGGGGCTKPGCGGEGHWNSTKTDGWEVSTMKKN